MCKLGDESSKQMLLKRIRDRGLGMGPPAARGYGGRGAKTPADKRFFGKTSCFNATRSQFARVESHLKAPDF